MKSDKKKRRKYNLYTATLLTSTTILVGEINVVEIMSNAVGQNLSNSDDKIISSDCGISENTITIISHHTSYITKR